jgi:hypothetical protein
MALAESLPHVARGRYLKKLDVAQILIARSQRSMELTVDNRIYTSGWPHRHSYTDLFPSNDVPCAFSRPSGLSPARVGAGKPLTFPSKFP